MPRPHTVYAISAGRPANTAPTQDLFHPDPVTWVVPWHERHEYATAGAHTVLPVRDPAPPRYALAAARNAAMDHAAAQGAICIQTDDDCRGFKRIEPDGTAHPTPWPSLRDALLDALDGHAHLAGVPPTDNPYFARGKRLDYGFIIGSLCATDTAAIRWDETLPFKEDYDYTCAHLAAYGAVARLDMYVAAYQHYSNRGGAVTNRTPEAEQHLAAELIQRWPQYLRPHPNRPAELSFIPRRTT